MVTKSITMKPRHIKHDTHTKHDTDTSTPLVTWENDKIECNCMCRCCVGHAFNQRRRCFHRSTITYLYTNLYSCVASILSDLEAWPRKPRSTYPTMNVLKQWMNLFSNLLITKLMNRERSTNKLHIKIGWYAKPS